jgi:hypothetical protein
MNARLDETSFVPDVQNFLTAVNWSEHLSASPAASSGGPPGVVGRGRPSSPAGMDLIAVLNVSDDLPRVLSRKYTVEKCDILKCAFHLANKQDLMHLLADD